MPARSRQPALEGSVTACNAISSKLAADYRRLGTWRAVGRKYGITAGMALRVGKQGYEPKDAVIRGRLGMATLALGPACAHCGQVHVADVCTAVSPRDDLHPVTVWTRRVRSGAVVLARSRRCARRRCKTHFVPMYGEKYCSDECRKRVQRSRRRKSQQR